MHWATDFGNSSATPYGLCTPKLSSWRAMTTVCQIRSLQREYIFAVKLLVLARLAWSPHCCWCYHFCVLFCTVCTEVSLLSWKELGESTGAVKPRVQKQKPCWNTPCLLQALQATSRKPSVGACLLLTCQTPGGGWCRCTSFPLFTGLPWLLSMNAQIPSQTEEYN